MQITPPRARFAAKAKAIHALAVVALLTAAAPFTDYHSEAPGTVHRITADELPQPYATRSAVNTPTLVERPAKAWPKAPPGFEVTRYAQGLIEPRVIRTAPNGDVFVAESAAGRVSVLRGFTPQGTPQRTEVFADGLDRPYGLAFFPPGPDPHWLYVGGADAVLRIPYRSGDLHSSGTPQRVAELPSGGGHWTRDVAFSTDGKLMFVAVGSASNVADPDTTPAEAGRAMILALEPDGSHRRVYAWGIRNPSGLAVDPDTGQLWCSVNERDGLGDNLVPDYITHVQEGGFYGWPWWYIGEHPDPRHRGKHPELGRIAIVPDVLLQPHDASLQMTFYRGTQFPMAYRGNIFAAEHGSWNRSTRTGYEVIRVRLEHGRADGAYEDFLTGFVVDDRTVWGRPVGVAEAVDGSLLVTDDASNSVWRVRYVGR
jgi:glucose/arabinose dehydrogenase